LYIALLVFHNIAIANTLSGKVVNKKTEPLSFANVYILGTTKGTTTNEEGKYQIELSPGGHSIVFNFIGYKKHVEEVLIGQQDVKLNITLHPEEIMLKEIVVSASEDPAYAIIRNAIAKRKFHYDQVESYKCTTYTKGLQRIISAPDKIFGQRVNFDGSLDSNNAGIVYLSESISELYFKKPDLVKETMISSKVSGDSQAFSWNRAGDFSIFNFYRNNIKIEFISDRVFISPISDNAMLFYKYRLEGFYLEDGNIINKIRVIPRRQNDPVFSGYIYIVEDRWNIHSIDVYLTKKNQINYIDTLNVNQVYVPVDPALWMLFSQRFDFNFDILNIKARGYFGIIYQDYEVNINMPKKTFTNEILKVEEEANKKDSAYWKINRPVPLTHDEIKDYSRKDSLEELKKSREYLRQIDREANKFTPWDLILGYGYRNTYKKVNVDFMPYIQGFQYNTVEGFNLRVTAEIRKELEKRKEISVEPTVRYGFSNKHFNGMLKTRYDYNRTKHGFVGLDFGRYVFQFNRSDPISELVNSFYSLFLGENYMKIFEESFVALRHRTELTNGLMLWSNVTYARRYSLSNSSSVSVKDEEKRDFNPNITFTDHDAFTMSLTLRWRPGQRYISRPDQKISIGSKYPDFTLNYKKSTPGVFKSDRSFDLLEFKISDDMAFGLFGNTEYIVKLGTFLNNGNVGFMDLKHFDGNQTYFGQHYLDGFQLLDYYVASTTDKYVEAHLQHHFDGFIFNKIPGIRKLKFQAVAGAHFIYSEEYKDYLEISTGIENILRVIRVDFVTGFSNNHKSSFGVRVGLDFNQL